MNLAIFKFLETVLLFHRKVLPGPTGGFENSQRYSRAGAHPLWEVTKPSVSVQGTSCNSVHTQITFLPPLSPPTGEKRFKSLEAATPLRLSFNCKEATCESDMV